MSSGPLQRLTSVDAMRGLVVLLLIPDMYGAFSFHQMAKAHPDDAFWQSLASWFTHVKWTGAAIWDFVMPVFIYVVGVSLWLSHAARLERGESAAGQHASAAIRVVTLIVVGLLLDMRPTSLVGEFLPIVLVIAIGLPLSIASRGTDAGASASARASRWKSHAFSALLLVGALAWLRTHVPALGDYTLTHIFVQIGLAYLFAYLLLRTSMRTQLVAAAALVAGYGAAFVLYTPPPGAVPIGEALPPHLSAWNNGTNVSATFDRWFLNLLPRAQPHLGNDVGVHTLQFVPLVATMLIGIVAARWLALRRATGAGIGPLYAAGALAIVAGFALTPIVPLVKWIWTPSWALVSTGVATLLFAVLYDVCDLRAHRRWALPLVVLGANAVLLYTLAARERWRILAAWERLLGGWPALSWQPIFESLLVLATLWLVAALLYRYRILLRL